MAIEAWIIYLMLNRRQSITEDTNWLQWLEERASRPLAEYTALVNITYTAKNRNERGPGSSAWRLITQENAVPLGLKAEALLWKCHKQKERKQFGIRTGNSEM